MGGNDTLEAFQKQIGRKAGWNYWQIPFSLSNFQRPVIMIQLTII